MRSIRLEPHGCSARLAKHQSEIDQGIQLAMRRSRARAGLARDLAQVKPFIGMPKGMS